ncbi:UvrD-helicase domain-containing protein [Sinimarinibacterium thermocellulolyticum]|uniref:DNA 3'-5' helicase n=1 Tax=Sinimarinibacterium thermocellulolyticum TaxID=3170016 RepID=A0ABV2A8T5_9GAMM
MSAADALAADARARADALDPTRSFIVQAPAGSGKTELLTQRLLVLLAGVDEPEEIVAITFTRKAAAEMRHRVFDAIGRARESTPPPEPHRQHTWTLARAVLARSQARGWRLDETPQRLRIRTIDALCAEIVRQSPLGSGLGGALEIADDPVPLYREAARAVLRALETDLSQAAAVARVLEHLDNRTARLEQQLIELLRRRDQWLALVTRSASAGRTRALLEAAFADVIRAALARADAAIPPALKVQWLRSATHASAQRRLSAPELPLHRVDTERWPVCEPSALPHWRALLDLVFTAERNWRTKVDATLGFPAGKTKAEKALLEPARSAHQALIGELAAVDGAQEALAALFDLPAACYSDEEWAVLEALLDTLRLAAAELRLVFAARGVVDFAEIAANAVAALGDAEAPSELALRLDYRVRHLLVDEFQDTSQTQWRLLQGLTAGWSADDGRTLFAVGDPMQSIYRFREADVGLFLDAVERGIGALPLTPLRLQRNFRSQAGLVDWVNTHFVQVMPQHDDRDLAAVSFCTAAAAREPLDGHAVTVHALIDATAAAEAERVLHILRTERARDPGARIAILVRNRGHLDAIGVALRDAGIDYQAVDIESLSERPLIGDLRALTLALLHPLDRIAWLAVLRAPWCGLKLADLHALAADLPAHDSLLAAMHDPARVDRLGDDGRERLLRLRAVIAQAQAQRGRLPLRRWVEATWVALGGPACATAPTALADAAAYFDCLQRLAPGTTLEDPSTLDLALHELKASAEGSGDAGISVMTIHKSKGLEFDVVIVPGLGRDTRSDDPPPVVWEQLTDGAGKARLLLAPVQATGAARSASYDYLRLRQQRKQRYEDGRLLYVAVTRARQRLHLVGAVARGADGKLTRPPERSLLARLWPAVRADFDAAAQAPTPAEDVAPVADAPPDPPPLRRLRSWPIPPRPAGLPLPTPQAAIGGEPLRFDWAGETARAVGVLYHRYVQRIAEDGVGQWTAARCRSLEASLQSALRDMGVPSARRGDAAARVLRALVNTLDDARGRWLLDSRHTDAVSEFDLSTLRDGLLQRRRIDRCFVDGGVRWIVDFKTSTHEGADSAGFVRNELARYRAQLQDYCALMRDYDPAHPPRAALYLPLIEDPALRWIELDEA